MANQILLNFAVPFEQTTATTATNISYISKIALIVKSLDTTSNIKECFTMSDVASVTDNKAAQTIFDNSSNSVFIIYIAVGADISELETILNDNSNTFFTLFATNDYTDTQKQDLLALSFDGVKALETADEATAETFTNNCIVGYSSNDNTRDSGVLFAISSLTNAIADIKNQQYINYTGSNTIDTVGDLTLANSLFDKRITFYLNDDEQGIRLASFFDSSKSASSKYVAEVVKVAIQDEITQYLSKNQPYNIKVARASVQTQTDTVITQYEQKGYLDDSYNNNVVVTAGDQQFEILADLDILYSVALWRVRVFTTSN